MFKPLLALSLVCLVGCLDSEEKTTEQKNQGLVYCAEANPVSFNPQVTTTGSTIDIIANQLYDRLLSIDPVTAEFQPELASDWKISPDGKAITFTLRKRVKFHTTKYISPSMQICLLQLTKILYYSFALKVITPQANLSPAFPVFKLS